MEVFINRIPPHCTERQLKRYMTSPLAEFGINDFVCEKLGNKAYAKLIFLDTDKGKRFISKYGKSDGQRRPLIQLNMNGHYINCAVSKNQPNEYFLRSLKSRAAQSVASSQIGSASRHDANSSFEFSHLRCGVWSFINNELVFVPHFIDSRRGRVLFGHRQLALLYEDRNSLESNSAYRVNIKYFDVDTATTGDYKRPTVTFTLHVPPVFYSKPSIDLTTVFANLSFLGVNGLKLPPLKNKKRITSINQAHSDVVGTCFVY
ncbi:RNA-directed RNA polymerase, partial [Aureobasidium melanogenum]